MKINYKIITLNGKTYHKTKTVTYNKIPKYGTSKSLTIKGSSGSSVIIKKITWKQTHRVWNNYY